MATQTRDPGGGGINYGTYFSPYSYSNLVDSDDGTYVANDDGGTTDNEFYTFTAFSLPAGSISISVEATFRIYNTQAPELPYTSVAPRIRVNGTNYSGGYQTSQDAWGTKTYTWTTNPDTGLSWTRNDINGSGSNPLQQMGLTLNSNSGLANCRCAKLYLTVTYTLASPPDIPDTTGKPYACCGGGMGASPELSSGHSSAGTNTNPSGYTFIDFSAALPKQSTIFLVGVYSTTTGQTIKYKAAKDNGDGTFTVEDLESFVHSSSGFQWHTLTTPYVVPTGNYYLGFYISANHNLMVSTDTGDNSAYISGDHTGTDYYAITSSHRHCCAGYKPHFKTGG